MLSEFEDRTEGQRLMVKIVNSKFKSREELCSLSKNSIDRWARANQISEASEFLLLILRASEQLAFLASKSQEHIADPYVQSRHLFNDMLNQVKHFKL